MINLGSIGGMGKYRKEKLKFYDGTYDERHQIFPGDILISNAGFLKSKIPIGSSIIVPNNYKNNDHYIFSLDTTRVVTKSTKIVSNLYLFYSFQQCRVLDRIAGFSNGTTVIRYPNETLEQLPLLVPSGVVLKKFESIVLPLHERIALADRENEVLAQTRDTLLPKLISGELPIPEAERLLEEVEI